MSNKKQREPRNLIALMRRITEQTNRMIVAELSVHGIEGIVPSHGGILTRLFTGHQYTMQEMAAAIHRTRPTLTVLVRKLEEQGYVRREKSEADSRVTFLCITAKGRALAPVFQEISDRMNAIVYRGLSDDAAHQMAGQLRQILEQLSGERIQSDRICRITVFLYDHIKNFPHIPLEVMDRREVFFV